MEVIETALSLVKSIAVVVLIWCVIAIAITIGLVRCFDYRWKWSDDE